MPSARLIAVYDEEMRVALVISVLFLGKGSWYWTSVFLFLIFVSSSWFVLSPCIYFAHSVKSLAIRSVQPYSDSF